MNSDDFIRAENITKVYPGPEPVHAVRPCTFGLRNGGSYAIIGPSGSGKSTLLHLIGLLDAPTSGRVLIEFADSHDMRDAQRTNLRAQKIGFVFQQFHLIGHLTAAENIQLRLAAAAVPRSLRRTLADEALERVGLTHRSDFFPYQLSGGEQQRVAIARGIAGSPLLLLCDEPSGNLDVANTQVVIDLLATLNAEGQTVLVVTHDMAVANWVDHIFEMSDGYLQT